VISVGVHKLNYTFSEAFGFNIQETLGFTLLVFPFLFLLLAYIEAQSLKNFSPWAVSSHVRFITIYSIFLLLYGYVSGNSTIFLDEVWTALIIFFSYKLGTLDSVWNLFRGKIIWVYLIFAFFVFLATQYKQKEIVYGNYDIQKFEGITVTSEAYNVSPILDLWPFIFLIHLYSPKKGLWIQFATYMPFIIYLLFQIYFLKRAPTGRAIVYLIVGVVILVLSKKSQIRNLGIIISMLISLFIFFKFMPENLVERFLTEDISRQVEFQNMLSSLNYVEVLFGRGLGGEFVVGTDGVSERVNKYGRDVKSTLHIGIGDSILKGGLVLFFAILSHVFVVLKFGLFNIRRIGDIGFTAFVFLLVFVIFRLIEGGLTPGSVFNAFGYGLSLGALDKLRFSKYGLMI
jgi:hypothetical protein